MRLITIFVHELGIKETREACRMAGMGNSGLVSLNRDQGQDSGCGQLFINAVNGNMRGDLDLAGYISQGAQDLVFDLSFRALRRETGTGTESCLTWQPRQGS